MSPNIIKSHIYAKDIFKAEKIHNSKLKYLNLKIRKKKNKSIFQGSSDIPRTSLESWGVYFMFFKTSLIYVGSYCGKKTVLERWEKHLKTDTTRFQRVNFEVINGKAPFIDQDRLEKLEFFKNKIIKNYGKKDLKKSNIYRDIIEDILSINLSFSKKYLQIIANDGNNHSPNRFRVANYFWDDHLKNRGEDNIFNDFEFFYFKFENFKNFVSKNSSHEENKKKFQKFFEKPFIKKFSPPANATEDKKNKEFKIVHNISIINEIEDELRKSYDGQSFFE